MTDGQVRERLRDIGEFELISRLRRALGRVATPDDPNVIGIGDDAARVPATPDRDTLYTKDIQISGRHFIDAAMSAGEIGERAVAVAVSDIFAMGAKPDHLLLSLGLPLDFYVDDAVSLYRGVKLACERWGCFVLGGNVAATVGPWFVDVTAIGSVATGRVLTRYGARPGDGIWVTGYPGSSRVGLLLLQHILEESDKGIGSGREKISRFVGENEWAACFLDAYLRPSPRADLSGRLHECGVTALVDISDGWLADLKHIAEASHLSAAVSIKHLPRRLAEWNRAHHLLKFDLYETLLDPSDDYELLFTAPESSRPLIQQAAKTTNTPCTRIGGVGSGTGSVHVSPATPSGRLPRTFGWDHFR